MSTRSLRLLLTSFLSLIIYLPLINARFTDHCASLNTKLDHERFTMPICDDMIGDAFATNAVLQHYAAKVGLDMAEAVVTQLIAKDSTSKKCSFPENAVEAPTSSDVCAFTCASGTTICDGKCKKSCASAVPQRRQQLPMPTSAPRCPLNQEMCRFGQSFKCVNTQTSLVSCGGCMNARRSKRGKDCSEIPGVDAVACRRGVCEVETCLKGYTFNAEDGSCSLQS
jgi:hypothetical protein